MSDSAAGGYTTSGMTPPRGRSIRERVAATSWRTRGVTLALMGVIAAILASSREGEARWPERVWLRETAAGLDGTVFARPADGGVLKRAWIESWGPGSEVVTISRSFSLRPNLLQRAQEIVRGPGDYGGTTETREYALLPGVPPEGAVSWRELRLRP